MGRKKGRKHDFNNSRNGDVENMYSSLAEIGGSQLTFEWGVSESDIRSGVRLVRILYRLHLVRIYSPARGLGILQAVSNRFLRLSRKFLNVRKPILPILPTRMCQNVFQPAIIVHSRPSSEFLGFVLARERSLLFGECQNKWPYMNHNADSFCRLNITKFLQMLLGRYAH